MKRVFPLLLLLAILPVTFAQEKMTQTIRGIVVDKISKSPLIGATIILLNTDPPVGVVTNTDGEFKIQNVPIGRQGLQIQYLGYKTTTLNNLLVNSAKELVVYIELEEDVVKADEVVITAYSRKDQPINKMATVSARSFTIEETEKYAGSRGDVARMAMNYAGVAVANDQRNDIVIRGNSPSGLLWRLDDVDIPNPNHFAEEGTTGGPVGMLNNNTLRNSDFFTGAFPAEYGNALSGVFDLKMRSGNNENHEFMLQSGFNGFELGAEGPFSNNYKGSYLINARYSTLELLYRLGIRFGTGGVPKYKDVSFKLDFPLKKGKISFFGVGGMSEIAMLAKDQKEEDMYSWIKTDLYSGSEMAVGAVSYTHFHNDKTYSKFSISSLYQCGHTTMDTLDVDEAPHQVLDHKIKDFRVSTSYYISKKFNARLSTKNGCKIDRIGYDLDGYAYDSDINAMRRYALGEKSLVNGVTLTSVYSQWQYKIGRKITLNPGVHFIYFDLTDDYSFEPRIGLSYKLAEGHKINLGYGKHSHIQALKVYFFETRMDQTTYIQTNKDLGFTLADHYVIGHDWNINNAMRLKTEVYYQDLYHIPIENRPTSYSSLNTGDTWGLDAVDSLVNKGTGYNYGIEFTLEKFLSNGYYYLTTLSLFESKFKNVEGELYNTLFNGQYVWNGLFGKEFDILEKHILSFDVKVTYAGGKWYTPIDTVQSKIQQETVRYGDDKAFSEQYAPFLKMDVKIGFRRNKAKYSEEFQFYIENVTNHKNLISQIWSTKNKKIADQYQLSIFPMVLYRIYF